MKATAEKGRDVHQLSGLLVAGSVTSKESESMLQRYFYDTLASYLSLYIRPKDQVVEIEPRSKALCERFANYQSVSQAVALEEPQLRGDLESAGRFIFAEAIWLVGRRIQLSCFGCVVATAP